MSAASFLRSGRANKTHGININSKRGILDPKNYPSEFWRIVLNLLGAWRWRTIINSDANAQKWNFMTDQIFIIADSLEGGLVYDGQNLGARDGFRLSVCWKETIDLLFAPAGERPFEPVTQAHADNPTTAGFRLTAGN